MGFSPARVSRETGINEGYISQLISGEKSNPSYGILREIADHIGVPVAIFEKPPPDPKLTGELANLPPSVRDKLLTQKF